MSKVIKINTNQERYKERLVDYDRFSHISSAWWDYTAKIGGKKYLAHAGHGGTVPQRFGCPVRTSAITSIACVDDDTVVVLGAQISANRATRASAVAMCMFLAFPAGGVAHWSNDARWLWNDRSLLPPRKAWGALVKAYENIVSREEEANNERREASGKGILLDGEIRRAHPPGVSEEDIEVYNGGDA